MLRSLVSRALLAGALGLFGVPVDHGALPRAEAGPKGYARKVLRHKEHQLKRTIRHQKREEAREKRQVANIKRTLKRHKR